MKEENKFDQKKMSLSIFNDFIEFLGQGKTDFLSNSTPKRVNILNLYIYREIKQNRVYSLNTSIENSTKLAPKILS